VMPLPLVEAVVNTVAMFMLQAFVKDRMQKQILQKKEVARNLPQLALRHYG